MPSFVESWAQDRLSPEAFVSDFMKGLVLPDSAVFLVGFQKPGTRQPCPASTGVGWLDPTAGVSVSL